MTVVREAEGTGSEFGAGLHLVALCAFAIAQPLFDLLGRHGEFFVARHADRAEILGLAFGLIALPPLLAVATLRLARRGSPAFARRLDIALVAGLLAATALPPLLRAGATPELVSVALALAAGVAGAFAYARFVRVRSALRVLAIAPLLFAALFLGTGDVRKLVFPPAVAPAEDGAVAGDVPVVLVVFDELPLASLLAADGSIDALRYPAFARFAANATWYREASAVSSRTNLAVPAILTGRYPPLEHKLPIRADHPENLFSLLGSAYTLKVFETETDLHPRSSLTHAGKEHAGGLAADVAVLYAHILLPKGLQSSLPSIGTAWGGFGDATRTGDAPEPGADLARRRSRKRDRAAADVEIFERFVASIDEPTAGDRRTLYFLHVTLPHGDWQLLPDGRRYAPDQRFGFVGGRWLEAPWWSTDAHRRHLLQLAYTDHLLGRLLDRLASRRVYDPALVILTADHGASFWPGGSFRKPAKSEHPEDLLSVPLLVKQPHQREAAIDDRFAESVDLLPTIASVVGAEIPWTLDGCSLLAPDCPERATRRLYIEELYRKPKVLHFEPGIVRRDATLRRKVALFGAGDATTGLLRAGFGDGLVNRPVDSFSLSADGAGVVRLGPTMRRVLAGEIPGRIPARIVGRLELASAAPGVARVAVAVDGVVRSVVPAAHDGVSGPRVAALLPPNALPASPDALALYLVTGPPGRTTLRPLELR